MLLSLPITHPSRCHHHGAHWGVLLAPAGLPVEVTQAPVSVSDPPALVVQQVTSTQCWCAHVANKGLLWVSTRGKAVSKDKKWLSG